MGSMRTPTTPPILLEDNHCLAFDKPAGVLSQGDETGDPSLDEIARAYLKEAYQKPGNVYVGLVHRLDRPTSGVVLLARTSKAAARLSEQFRGGEVEKVYEAVVEGGPPADEGAWTDWLLKDPAKNTVASVPPRTPGSKEAELRYRVLGRRRGLTSIELHPGTGRGHQLRVQLASRGWPIVGDRKYGATSTLLAPDGGPRIALHARELTFRHPTQDRNVTLVSPLPSEWPKV